MNTRQGSLIQGVIAPAGRMESVVEYYFSRKLREIARMRAEGQPVINLGIGSPDLPPHPEVIETLGRNAEDPAQHAYQKYTGLSELRTSFADWYARHFHLELDADTEVLPLIGSKEGIMHISMTYVEQGDEVLVPDPGYPTYRSAALLAGATVRTYSLTEENGWLPDLDALARQGLERVKIMWLNYPHMPTGSKAKIEDFDRLVAFAREHRILLINDNPYAFILNDAPLSILQAKGAEDVALELCSLSKSHNMAGWRVGALLGAAHYLRDVLRFKSNMDSGMFKPLQLAAAAALKLGDDWFAQLNEAYGERRKTVFEILDLLGATYDVDQVGMFVWAKVPSPWSNGYELSDELLHGACVFMTPGGIFGQEGERYIRLSLCQPEEILVEARDRVAERIQKTKGKPETKS